MTTQHNILRKLSLYSIISIVAFILCFSAKEIGSIWDVPQYFINGKYITEYKQVFIGYPNQMFSLFWYLGYLITDSTFALSFVLFYPLFFFGVYSCYKICLFFTKQSILSLFYTIVILSIDWIINSALKIDIYLVYFFFFTSTVYLCLYYPKKIYLISFYLATGSLFRNQLIMFIPFIPFIVNPNITTRSYIINLLKIASITIFIQFGFENIKTILGVLGSDGNNWYIKEFRSGTLFKIFSAKIIKVFINSNFSNYFFYLLIAPCLLIFNKKFYNGIYDENKKLIKVFLILAIFIYIMPALMYATPTKISSYSILIRRYSINMFVLLIPIYHFILKNILVKSQLFYVKTNVFIALFIFMLFLPILNLKAPLECIKSTINNLKHENRNKGLLGIKNKDYKEINTVISDNFNSHSAFLFSHRYFMLFFLPTQKYSLLHYVKDNEKFDGVFLLGSKKADIFELNGVYYKKIYEKKFEQKISIYKIIKQ